jgi:FtsZ-interacting cell division protein ZipA
MEIIIFVAVVVVAALLWSGYVKTKKTESDHKHPLAQFNTGADKPWPYGEKVAEGKIHVKSADVAPGKSAEDRVETPAPTVADATAENKAEAVAKVKKAPAKKTAAKPAAAKKAPAKKKSI